MARTLQRQPLAKNKSKSRGFFKSHCNRRYRKMYNTSVNVAAYTTDYDAMDSLPTKIRIWHDDPPFDYTKIERRVVPFKRHYMKNELIAALEEVEWEHSIRAGRKFDNTKIERNFYFWHYYYK